MLLVNERTNETVASVVELALTRAERRQGLLGRDRFDDSAAMIIAPCFAVHTAFMRFPIDVVFVDRDGCVVKIVRAMRPWRIAASWRARGVVEFAGGTRRELQLGDRLYLAPPSAKTDANRSVWWRGFGESLRSPGSQKL